MRGNPLMPTTPQKARKLLKNKKARVVYRTPFTIQLKYPTGEAKQPLRLGKDSGYSFIGFSVVSDKREIMSGTVELRNDVSKKITEKKMYRTNRRSRLWYREPRFLNRGRKKGWFPPSLQHKIDTHERLDAKFKKILPITETTIEVATFDTQKMQNPEISGVEYQQGELQGYEVKEYLLEKYKRTCAYCGKTGIPLEVEHIVPKSRGGSNRVSNLTISCHDCNAKKDNQTATEFGYPEIQAQAGEGLRATAFMNVVRKHVAERLKHDITYGYETKYNRLKLGLPKSHVNDAFVIAGGTIQKRCKPFTVKQVRRNNRSIQTNRKGFKPSIRRQRYALQPFDLVRHKKKEYRVKGMFNYGTWVRLVDKEGNIKNVNVKKVKLVKHGKGLQFTFK